MSPLCGFLQGGGFGWYRWCFAAAFNPRSAVVSRRLPLIVARPLPLRFDDEVPF